MSCWNYVKCAQGLPLLLLPALFAAGCPTTGPGGVSDDSPSFETIVENAAFPVDLAFAPDGRVFYTEKATGRIRVIKHGAVLDAPFATLPVNSFNERGLLSIALHPNFATNGLLYVFYTNSSTGHPSVLPNEADENHLARLRAAGDTAEGPQEVLVRLPLTSAGNHNGGIIRFGPDGVLYVAFGDLGFLYEDAQDPTLLPGKILRYRDDGTIPADNPFGPTSPVFAIGLRNPFGMGFDGAGRLFLNENGPNNHDEVHLIVAGSNCGWPAVHGFADDAAGDPTGETAFAAATPAYREPLVDKDDGSVGAAGLVVNPGDVYGAALRGQVFFGEFTTGRIRRVQASADGLSAVDLATFATAPGRVNGMAFAPDGYLWVATTTAILRVMPGGP